MGVEEQDDAIDPLGEPLEDCRKVVPCDTAESGGGAFGAEGRVLGGGSRCSRNNMDSGGRSGFKSGSSTFSQFGLQPVTKCL